LFVISLLNEYSSEAWDVIGFRIKIVINYTSDKKKMHGEQTIHNLTEISFQEISSEVIRIVRESQSETYLLLMVNSSFKELNIFWLVSFICKIEGMFYPNLTLQSLKAYHKLKHDNMSGIMKKQIISRLKTRVILT